MKRLGIYVAAVLCITIIPATTSKAAYSISDNCEHMSLTTPTGATSMTNTYGEVYNYDTSGKVVAKTTASGYVVNYTYDGAGNKAMELEYTYDGQLWGGTAYQYDALGRISAEVAGSGEVLYTYTYSDNTVTKVNPGWSYDCYTYTYDKNGNLTEYKIGDSETYTYTYDKAGNVTSINSTTPYGTWQKYEYTYDKNGNIATETQTSSYGITNAYTYTNVYDAAGRLTTVDDGHGTIYQFTY